MTVLSAYSIAGGIQINREIDAGTVSCEFVEPGQPGWEEAVAAVGGFEVAPEPSPERDLSTAIKAAVAGINRLAGTVRARYVTDLPGQSALYLMKETEARAWLVDADPIPSEYPLIAAEIGITGSDGSQVAQVYLNLASLYVSAAAQLENARLGCIAEAEVAATPEDADAVMTAFAALIASMSP